MKITGVDLSLTATGVASIEVHMGLEGSTVPYVQTQVIKSKPDDGTLLGRHRRMEAIAAEVTKFCKGSDLIVVEGPSYSSAGRGTWDRAGLWWWVVTINQLMGGKLIDISPKTRAKWATNNGNSSKSAVAVAIGRMWPEVTTQDDNDADALCFATMGAQLLEVPNIPTKAYQKQVLEKVRLP